MYLAMSPDELQTVADLSKRLSVSRNHLMKVVNNLANLGYVDAQRGRGGGLRLAKPKESIRIGAVVEDMEPSMDVVDCTAGEGCPYITACKLKHALRDASRAFVRSLDDVTLAELVSNEKQLLKLVD